MDFFVYLVCQSIGRMFGNFVSPLAIIYFGYLDLEAISMTISSEIKMSIEKNETEYNSIKKKRKDIDTKMRILSVFRNKQSLANKRKVKKAIMILLYNCRLFYFSVSFFFGEMHKVKNKQIEMVEFIGRLLTKRNHIEIVIASNGLNVAKTKRKKSEFSLSFGNVEI